MRGFSLNACYTLRSCYLWGTMSCDFKKERINVEEALWWVEPHSSFSTTIPAHRHYTTNLGGAKERYFKTQIWTVNSNCFTVKQSHIQWFWVACCCNTGSLEVQPCCNQSLYMPGYCESKKPRFVLSWRCGTKMIWPIITFPKIPDG